MQTELKMDWIKWQKAMSKLFWMVSKEYCKMAPKIAQQMTLKNKEVKEECLNFLELMQNEWGTRVTKLARLILALRGWVEGSVTDI